MFLSGICTQLSAGGLIGTLMSILSGLIKSNLFFNVSYNALKMNELEIKVRIFQYFHLDIEDIT